MYMSNQARRTPLHYAFVKMADPLNYKQYSLLFQEFSDKKRNDPIGEVSSICSVKGIKPDIRDIFGRAPLHYASQRGATICALTLISEGKAEINLVDSDGNTLHKWIIFCLFL